MYIPIRPRKRAPVPSGRSPARQARPAHPATPRPRDSPRTPNRSARSMPAPRQQRESQVPPPSSALDSAGGPPIRLQPRQQPRRDRGELRQSRPARESQDPRGHQRMARRAVTRHRVHTSQRKSAQDHHHAQVEPHASAGCSRAARQNPKRHEQQHGDRRRAKDSPADRLGRQQTVLARVWPSSSGRSRSTAIASAFAAEPSSLLIDGLLLIPPFKIMNGPAAARPPAINRPSAHRVLATGNSNDRQNGSTKERRHQRHQNHQALGPSQIRERAADDSRHEPRRASPSAAAASSTRRRPTRRVRMCFPKGHPPERVR